jgi:DNA-binding NarL/FixJ family response regulator
MSRTVLIADDSELIRRSIRKVLAEEPAIEVVGEAVDFANAIALARDLQPDVLLLDLHMPDDKVIEPAQIKANLSTLASKTHVIGISLSGDTDVETSELGKSLGASSVLEKANFYDELVPAILGFT